jgi:hypothetical protein
MLRPPQADSSMTQILTGREFFEIFRLLRGVEGLAMTAMGECGRGYERHGYRLAPEWMRWKEALAHKKLSLCASRLFDNKKVIFCKIGQILNRD